MFEKAPAFLSESEKKQYENFDNFSSDDETTEMASERVSVYAGNRSRSELDANWNDMNLSASSAFPDKPEKAKRNPSNKSKQQNETTLMASERIDAGNRSRSQLDAD